MELLFSFHFNSVQSNSVADVASASFGVPAWVTGVVLVVFVTFLIYGGIQRISSVSSVVIPMMAIFYMFGAFIIIVINYDLIIPAFQLIFYHAFNPVAATGGFAGIIVAEAA